MRLLFATSREKDLVKISIFRVGQEGSVSRAAFYRNYDSKEEILKVSFKRSVHNIMEQLSHYDVKTDLIWFGFTFSAQLRKEAKVIQLALDYHFGKGFLSKPCRNF